MVVYLVKLLLAMSAEQGSRQLIWGALGGKEDEEKLRGGYISRSNVIEPSDFVLSEQGQNMQEKIWVCMCFTTAAFAYLACLYRKKHWTS